MTMSPATVMRLKVTVTGITLGRISRSTIRVSVAPIVLAATTKSRWAKDRLEARITRYMRGMVAMPRMIVMWKRDASQKVTMAITATMAGKARMMNETALRATSRRPPR